MHQYKEDNPKDRLYGILAACAAYMLIAFLIIAISITVKRERPQDELLAGGVLLEFGADEAGFGEEAPKPTPEPSKPQESEPEPQTKVTESELAVTATDSTATKKKEQTKEASTQNEKPKEEPKKKPSVNKNALFPGKSTSQGKGEIEGESGTTGSLDGQEGGSGAGGTTSGIGNASLAGRSLVGALPKPRYDVNSAGRVVVEVRVNNQGKVENATYRAQGSTTTNTALVRAAIDAAKMARFNIDEDAPLTQIGTISYDFKIE